MRSRPLLLMTLLSCLSGAAYASPMTYLVSVNTSSIAGTNGSLDFNFDPGPLTTQAASAQILSFTSNGSLTGSASSTGDASGSLPGTVTFDNATAFNDYFQDFTYGSTLSFDVSLYGPALSSPNGTSSSGSAFAFSMFSDAAGTMPVLTADTTDGFAYTVNVNLDGTTTATSYITTSTSPSPVPEPGSLLLLATATALGGISSLRNKVRTSVRKIEAQLGS